MKLEVIVSELQRLKGSGRWGRIAQSSKTDYTTIARIARGDMPNPGVLTCERIAAAIEAEAALPEPASDAEPAPLATKPTKPTERAAASNRLERAVQGDRRKGDRPSPSSSER